MFNHSKVKAYMSPLARYFGNRAVLPLKDGSIKADKSLQECIFKLVGDKNHYEVFYDLFSGSGSWALKAMELKLANRYVINDSYTPLSHLWQQIQTNPQKVIDYYRSYEESLKANHKFYNKLLEKYNVETNQDTKALMFAWLINCAHNGEPLFDKNNNFISASQIEQRLSEKDFIALVKRTHALFKENNVEFYSNDFKAFLPKITSNDCVIMDPPYPESDYSEGKVLYDMPNKPSVLQKSLHQVLKQLCDKHIPCVMLYGVGAEHSYFKELEDKAQLTHLVRASGGKETLFGRYPEHFYLTFPPTSLTEGMLEYKTISHLSKWVDILNAIESATYSARQHNEIRLGL